MHLLTICMTGSLNSLEGKNNKTISLGLQELLKLFKITLSGI